MLACYCVRPAGKTQLVRGKLAGLPEDMMSLGINFNYFTDVISFQKVLESPLEKKAGINYGPPGEGLAAAGPRAACLATAAAARALPCRVALSAHAARRSSDHQTLSLKH